MKKNNVHEINCVFTPRLVLLISDIHFDNPKCDRQLLKRHLDQALEQGADILFNGDTFCLMQGAYDPRKSKSDILPQHNVNNYLDAVIGEAIEWFSPYAHLIRVIGYGNHETSILKRAETDVIERFVSGLNIKNETQIQAGGYGGWVVYNFRDDNRHKATYKIKYFHGAGGAAPVTLGTIQSNRMQVFVAGADLIWQGHVHNDYELTYTQEYLTWHNKVRLKDVCHVRTATYKEEYNQGRGGWHVERGAAPKPLGGRWLSLTPHPGGGHYDTDYRVVGYTYRTT